MARTVYLVQIVVTVCWPEASPFIPASRIGRFALEDFQHRFFSLGSGLLPGVRDVVDLSVGNVP
ncbi:hypothetical protein JOF39_000703 [Glutamicibacter protophormiae]|uniref:Uncharacterized protein n=1 Tax=Glutamicibacter protophormiae TaxID=37930 RepID=A0ABS4XM86_GLUPR|nr:hypothetical protein [Glutamicibacter protophormiae]GGL77655.1 hypothetical protein GCM10010038_04720 [Glutamicibacter protophormiae]